MIKSNNAVVPTNIFDVARAVHQHMTTLPSPIRHLTLRPVDVQIPRRTSWWLVPTPRLPVFRYSKLFFHRQPVSSPGLLAGFSFERGVGGQLRDIVDPVLLMESNWYWRRFLNDIMAGLYSKPITRIQQQAQSPVLLLLELWNFNHLQRRTFLSRDPDDILVFKVLNEAIELEVQYRANQQLKVLNNVNRCYDLALHIEIEPAFSFHWIRFTFGAELIPPYHLVDNENSKKLWDHLLSPWMPLIG